MPDAGTVLDVRARWVIAAACVSAFARAAHAKPAESVLNGRLFTDVGLYVATTGYTWITDERGMTHSNYASTLARITFGIEISQILAGGEPSFHLTLGASGYTSSVDVRYMSGAQQGIGGDVTFDLPFRCVRLGGHAGVATSFAGKLVTAGPRVTWFDSLWAGVEVFHFTASADYAPLTTGLLVGGGITL